MSGSCPVGASVCRDAHAEVERLRAGIERLTRTGYISHTPDCVRERWWLDRYPDCGRCWEDSLRALLDPTEGEKP